MLLTTYLYMNWAAASHRVTGETTRESVTATGEQLHGLFAGVVDVLVTRSGTGRVPSRELQVSAKAVSLSFNRPGNKWLKELIILCNEAPLVASDDISGTEFAKLSFPESEFFEQAAISGDSAIPKLAIKRALFTPYLLLYVALNYWSQNFSLLFS